MKNSRIVEEIKEYVSKLSAIKNYIPTDLLLVRNGGDDFSTWAHQRVAIRVAQKLSTEYVNALLSEPEFKDGNSPYLKSRGKYNGGTWMHPLLFIDFAMRLNPSFKVKVLRFVYDQLIQYRNDAGDAYKEMAEAIQSIVPANESVMRSIKYVGHAVNIVIYGKHERGIRNKQAEEDKMKELVELEKDVTKLINKKFIKSTSQLREYLLSEYRERHEPKLLTD